MVLSAVVFRKAKDLEAVRVMREVRTLLRNTVRWKTAISDCCGPRFTATLKRVSWATV